MTEPASTELSFDEFSQTLELAVTLTNSIAELAPSNAAIVPGFIHSLDCCIEAIGIRRLLNNRPANSHHIDALHDLFCHREKHEVTVNRESFESWHEAAIKFVGTYNDSIWRRLKNRRQRRVVFTDDEMEGYFSDWAAKFVTWLSVQEPIDWQKVIVELRRERRLIGNAGSNPKGSTNADDQPAADTEAIPHGPDAIAVPAEKPDTKEILLKATDPAAEAYRDGGQWCDGKYAEENGVTRKQIDKALKKKGLFRVRLTERRKADAKGKPWVYRRAELEELEKAIEAEQHLGNPRKKSPAKKI